VGEKMTENDVETSQKEQEKELENKVLEQKEQQKQKISNEISYINPKKIKPHEINTQLYGREDIDEALLESIRTQGQLEPIVLDQDNNIISGHRRWKVLLKLKEEEDLKKKKGQEYKEIKAAYFQKYYNRELDEDKEAVVEFNRQRKKNPLQIYNEVEILEKIYAERAEKAKLKNLINVDVPDLELRGEHGRTVKKEAKATGLSTGTLGNLKYIGKKYREKDDNAEYVMDEMKQEHLSIDAAYKLLKLMEAANDPQAKGPRASETEKNFALKAQELVKKIKSGNATPNKAEKDFELFKKKYSDTTTKVTGSPKIQVAPSEIQEVPPKIQVIPPKGNFNVFVADPKSVEEAKKRRIPDAMDAALFLWATTYNLKERMDLMQSWGFSLKSIGIWNTEIKTGSFFEGIIEFLLLGVKGNLEPADDYRPNVIFKTGHKDNENKSEPVYEIAEKMFPGQHYADLFDPVNRENWGQPTFEEVRENSKENSKITTAF
jgi:N6-adenosine-specific RNA methylase IME4/ParB-like chromosome segregation protein Spo0J